MACRRAQRCAARKTSAWVSHCARGGRMNSVVGLRPFAWGAAAALLWTQAHAQETNSPPAKPTLKATTIETVVVTAERRAEDLQTVPAAVSAFTANTRDLVGIKSVTDVANFTPGVSYSAG